MRWIIPFPPGGGTEVISRTVGHKLSELWGQQVVADNRPGSGGTIGLAAAAKLPRDGYNLVLGQLANVAIAPALYPKLPYEASCDFSVSGGPALARAAVASLSRNHWPLGLNRLKVFR